MPKIAKPLVDTTLRNIKYDPVTKSKNMLSAGKGLVFIINKDNTKWWRFDYVRPTGRRNSISLGKYPLITIAKANALRDEARAKLAQGIDPSIVRKETKQAKQKELEKSENTLNNLIDEYLQVVRGGITEGYFKKMTRRIELDIRPYLGNKPIDEITHFELLACIKRIEDRGAIELAKRTLNYCEAIWRYAVSSGKALNNITANIDKKTVLKKRVKQNFPHITDEKELGVLLNAIDNYDGDYSTKMALKLLPYIFVRPANIRFMEWSEIDFDKAIWSILADKMKMKSAFIVPLSKQAIEILQEVHKYSGNYQYVFISPVSTIKPLSENTLNMGLMRLGYKDKMVSHGFRHTASTLLHENIEVHGCNSLIIEAQLAHAERNGVKATYNKAEYLSQRKQLMQWYADYLDGLKAQ